MIIFFFVFLKRLCDEKWSKLCKDYCKVESIEVCMIYRLFFGLVWNVCYMLDFIDIFLVVFMVWI